MAIEARRRRSEVATAFSDYVRAAGDTSCWRVTRALGSWLIFDLGGQVSEKTRNGQVQVGTSVLSIRGVYWWASGIGTSRINSERFSEGELAAIRLAVLGQRLDGVRAGSRSITFSFGDVDFHVDTTNRWNLEDDEEVCVFTVTGSVSLALYPSGNLRVWPLNSSIEKAA